MARLVDRDRLLPQETRALRAAMDVFGSSRLRPGQLDIVLAALRGEDVLAVCPTGFGKSIRFPLPAVMAGQASYHVAGRAT